MTSAQRGATASDAVNLIGISVLVVEALAPELTLRVALDRQVDARGIDADGFVGVGELEQLGDTAYLALRIGDDVLVRGAQRVDCVAREERFPAGTLAHERVQ